MGVVGLGLFKTENLTIYCRSYIIQIWTWDEGNVEFCGSEATILTEAKLRSILLPKIHRTHITRHHSSIFVLLYFKSLWLMPIGL